MKLNVYDHAICVLFVQAIENINSVGEEFFHSPDVVAFHSNFDDELSKNENFRTFMRNFELAYNGISDESSTFAVIQ